MRERLPTRIYNQRGDTMRPEGLKRHKIIAAYPREEFEKQLNEYENELHDKGLESYACIPLRMDGVFAIDVLYTIPETNKCPQCNQEIPSGATQHLKCGWKT
jgi:hypothetical protein